MKYPHQLGKGSEPCEGISAELLEKKGVGLQKVTDPRNAKSLLTALLSAGVSSSAWSISSVGKYDVSVMDLRCGTKGACIRRIVSQSTP
jgi:hypothetical protein